MADVKHTNSTPRLGAIDGMVFILVCLVIMGHCLIPNAPQWYVSIHTWIYSYHMAVFFFVCGFLCDYTYKKLNNFREYYQYLRRRSTKLGRPFICLGIPMTLLMVWKQGGHWPEMLEGCRLFLWDTMASPIIYFWFILVLLEFSVLAPLLCQSFFFLICGVSMGFLLFFYTLPRCFCLHVFSHYFLFYTLGISANKIIKYYGTSWIKWVIVVSLPVFVYSSLFNFPFNWLCIEFSAISAIFVIGRFLHHYQRLRPLLGCVSKNCYGIYLFGMIFIHGYWQILSFLPNSTLVFPLFVSTVVPVVLALSILCTKNRAYKWVIGG